MFDPDAMDAAILRAQGFEPRPRAVPNVPRPEPAPLAAAVRAELPPRTEPARPVIVAPYSSTPYHDALAACATDDDRATYLAALTLEGRAALSAEMAYLTMKRETPIQREYAEFKTTLGACVDDGSRLALLNSASPGVRAEMADDMWWASATVEQAMKRYAELLGEFDPFARI